MKRRKRPGGRFGAPPAEHLRMAKRWLRRADILTREALHDVKMGRCEDAVRSLSAAAESFGAGIAHASDAPNRDRPQLSPIADKIGDVRDAIARCFRDRGG